MNELFQVYVISLERGDRWPAQAAMLQRLGIAAQRWPAVDGRAEPLEALVQRWVADGALKADSDILRRALPDSWKQSVIGLIASTARLWRHLDALPEQHEWTLILEDDCELHPCLGDAEYVRAMWARLPADAEFVYFGTQMLAHMVYQALPHVGEREPITIMCEDVNPFFVRMRRPVFGAYAYAVRKRVLPKLLASLPTTCPIDNFDPKLYPIYAIKGPADWWRGVPRCDRTHLFWGVAAPRPGPSTINH